MSDEPRPGSDGETPPPPVVSPDGKFWWDGTQWQPFTTHDATGTSQTPSPAGPPESAGLASSGARVIPPLTHTVSSERSDNAGSGSKFQWSWLFRVAIPLAVLGWFIWPQISGWVSETGVDVASQDMDSITCDELADEAVRISEEDTGFGVKLLKVHTPQLVEDNRDDYEIPTGANRERIMACRGGGSWADGDTVDVRVELSVDADDEQWVFFKPMY
jgi:hypothetical protein